MRFSYRALDSSGKSVLGRLRAADRIAAQKKLAEKNFTIIFLKRDFFADFSFEKSLNIREKANFCFCLFQLLKAGVPMHDALSDLSKSRDFSPLLQEIFSEILNAVESGTPLSQALKNFPKSFDSVFVALIAAGEASGELPLILERLHKSLLWQEALAQKRSRLLIYPAIVSILVGSATLFLMIFLVLPHSLRSSDSGVDRSVCFCSIYWRVCLLPDRCVAYAPGCTGKDNLVFHCLSNGAVH